MSFNDASSPVVSSIHSSQSYSLNTSLVVTESNGLVSQQLRYGEGHLDHSCPEDTRPTVPFIFPAPSDDETPARVLYPNTAAKVSSVEEHSDMWKWNSSVHSPPSGADWPRRTTCLRRVPSAPLSDFLSPPINRVPHRTDITSAPHSHRKALNNAAPDCNRHHTTNTSGPQQRGEAWPRQAKSKPTAKRSSFLQQMMFREVDKFLGNNSSAVIPPPSWGQCEAHCASSPTTQPYSSPKKERSSHQSFHNHSTHTAPSIRPAFTDITNKVNNAVNIKNSLSEGPSSATNPTPSSDNMPHVLAMYNRYASAGW